MIAGTISSTNQFVLPSMTGARLACERCRFHKLRCQRSGPESAESALEACVRCTRAKAICTTKTRGRLGRPRSEKKSMAREGHLGRQAQRPDGDTSGESQLNPEPTNSSISLHSMSLTTNCTELLSIAMQTEQSSTPFSASRSPTIPAQTQKTFDTSVDAFDTTEDDLYRQLGFESFLGDSALDMTLFSDATPEILPTDNAPTTACTHGNELALSPPLSARLSPLESPENPQDPSLCLLDINKKLLEQHQRLKKVDEKCTYSFDQAEQSLKSILEIEIGEVLKLCQEFSNLLSQVLRAKCSGNSRLSLELRHGCELACSQDILSPLQTPASGPGSFTLGCIPRINNSSQISDPVIVLHMNTCYIYLIRNLILVISQLFQDPKSAKEMPTSLTRNPFSGLQIGGFALKNDSLQAVVLIQVVLHSLQEIELPLGVPGDYSVCGETKGRNANILEDLCSSSSFSDLFSAAMRQEESSPSEYGGGGARRLRELLKSVRRKLGPGSTL